MMMELIKSGGNWKEDFIQFASQYVNDLQHSARVLNPEMDLWATSGLKKLIGVLSDTFPETLILGNELASTYPNIFIALQILGTIPQ